MTKPHDLARDDLPIGFIEGLSVAVATATRFLSVFWFAAIPGALATAVLVFWVREPDGNRPKTQKEFCPADAFGRNRRVWAVIGLASVITLARFSEAFLLLRSLEVAWAVLRGERLFDASYAAASM